MIFRRYNRKQEMGSARCGERYWGAELNEQVEDVIQKTGISGVRNRRISALSKGYKQRVGIAQALLGNPKVIILDEPTVGLDPIQIIEIRDLITEPGKTHTVIFSSHILSEVQTICDQILMIAKGKLVAFDEPANLEKQLLAPNEIVLTTDAEEKELRKILSGVRYISALEVGSADEGLTVAHIKTDHSNIYELSRDVFYAFKSSDQAILEMTLKKGNLEDVFIELTEAASGESKEEEGNMYSYSYSTSFDGEGAITSAIDYVVTEDLPQLYVLEGHGESEMPSTLSDQIEKENYEIVKLSLLTVDEIPEEADCVVIYAPSSDISEKEAEMLRDYVRDGGKLLVAAGPVEDDSLTNLYSLLSYYDVDATEGIVVEGDRSHYAFNMPHVLMADMTSHAVTDSLMEENYYPILPIAQGLTVGYTSRGTVTSLLTTSDASFSKVAGYALTTYEKEDGDIDGPFAVAVAIEDNSGGEIVWFTSSYFLEDMYNAYSSGSNVDMAMNALSFLVGEREAIAIRSKSLNYNYLTISGSTSSLLKTLMIGVFPLSYLAIGILVILRKRKVQNEKE